MINFKNISTIFILFFTLFVTGIRAQYGSINIDDYIQNPEVFEENQLKPAAILIPFDNVLSINLMVKRNNGEVNNF